MIIMPAPTVHHLISQADTLKEQILKDSASFGEVLSSDGSWLRYQELQACYTRILTTDLELALDHKVEQELWNVVFKTHITALQARMRDKRNPARELLSWYLQATSGFYLQLLDGLCDAYNVDLPFRRKTAVFGFSFESAPKKANNPKPRRQSCLYICQDCLVHLGDIARYRGQTTEAKAFYESAVQLVPGNGQPYNQLALIEALRGDQLCAIYNYVRALSVKYPFQVAANNIGNTFNKLSDHPVTYGECSRLSGPEFLTCYLHLLACLHKHNLCEGQQFLTVLADNFMMLVSTGELSPRHLLRITVITIYTVNRLTDTGRHPEAGAQDAEYSMALVFLASMLNSLVMLPRAITHTEGTHTYPGLPAVKVITDWIRLHPHHLKSGIFTPGVWSSLSELLNLLESDLSGQDFKGEKYRQIPLPEERELQAFGPICESYSGYHYAEPIIQLSVNQEQFLRVHRMLPLKQWLIDNNLLTVPEDGDPVIVPFAGVGSELDSAGLLRDFQFLTMGENQLGSPTLLSSGGGEFPMGCSSPSYASSHHGLSGEDAPPVHVEYRKRNFQNVALQSILQLRHPRTASDSFRDDEHLSQDASVSDTSSISDIHLSDQRTAPSDPLQALVDLERLMEESSDVTLTTDERPTSQLRQCFPDIPSIWMETSGSSWRSSSPPDDPAIIRASPARAAGFPLNAFGWPGNSLIPQQTTLDALLNIKDMPQTMNQGFDSYRRDTGSADPLSTGGSTHSVFSSPWSSAFGLTSDTSTVNANSASGLFFNPALQSIWSEQPLPETTPKSGTSEAGV